MEICSEFMSWLPGVGRAELKADLSAALTGAIVVLPQGVAFATIAGMPPEYGLYAGMIPAMIAAFFGSSRHLVSGAFLRHRDGLGRACPRHPDPLRPAWIFGNTTTHIATVGALPASLPPLSAPSLTLEN